MDNALTEDPKTYTVLVVEDDPHTAELLSYNLSEAGFQVFNAEDGLSALHKLDIVTVDLIICDVMMPEMDGFALRERINEDPVIREIPFIFLTAKTTAEDQIHGLGMGVDEYVTKPFDPEVLLARVHAVLRRHENFARVARLDPLTKLLNRQTLQREIERELARIKRYPAVATFVFLDIDEFKHVNDEFGHAAGDHALGHLASALTKDIRTVDIVGRFGGEEFILYFPETPEEIGLRIIERMHATFNYLSESEGSGPLTFSAGLVEAPRDGSDFQTLCARADAAMYRAKKQGKAKVLVWKADMTEMSDSR
jgi:diguanylate cyclase (GGDEF)-like protein